jgi:hypothetical protein
VLINFGSQRRGLIGGQKPVTVLCGHCKAPITMTAQQFKYRRTHTKGAMVCSRKCNGAIQAQRAAEYEHPRR